MNLADKQRAVMTWLVFGLIFGLMGYGPFLFGVTELLPLEALTLPYAFAIIGGFCLFTALLTATQEVQQ